ncbi:Hypothetical Protein FCC1311_065702 [Hondaea fermentalgiana]|uniref:RGS domain-containing protein n=1 Tax=Hondaea fermentalgiana TaxID=2315210 RepID=A0A2R5GPT0_9STRA|nr:Hypothetical Protein FCC1311_065702 [Hondaea fermentalgiana]|eukprot:GBG30351.1 Hypothetical Protein FCC1311_065702 [Hondaea fermentalgiana]
MASAVEVLLQGWAERASADFAVADAAALENDMLGPKKAEYFAFVRVGEGDKSSFSLRFYGAQPGSNENVLCASVAAVLARTPAGSRAKLVANVDLSKQTQVTSSGERLTLSTLERTMILTDDPKNEPSTMLLYEYLHQTMTDISSRSTLASRVTKRLSRPNSSRRGPRAVGSQSTPPSGRRVTLRKNKMQERTRDIRTLADILGSSELRAEFKAFLKYAFAEENLEFVEAVEEFSRVQDQDERNQKFAAIVEEFIKESSPRQVNLPSFMSRMIVDSLADLEETGTPVPPDVFAPSLREIESLMFRNFFSTFVTQVEQRARRAAQAQEMAGSFFSIWTHAGLSGYNKLMVDFKPRISQIASVLGFLTELQGTSERYASQLQKLAGRYANMQQTSPFAGSLADNGGPAEGTLDRAVFQLFAMVHKRELLVREEAHDLELYGIAPLRELQATVSTSVQSIFDDHLPTVQRMVDSRAKLQNAIQEEAAAFNRAEAVRGEVKNGKPTKRQQAQLKKLDTECEQLVATREACELEVSGIEDVSGEAMMGAFDMLESLELHRLDTMRDTLTQIVLADRSSTERRGLMVQSLLFDCVEMNPVKELVSHARAIRERSEGSSLPLSEVVATLAATS